MSTAAIYYFSGTGNSYSISKRLCRRLAEQGVDAPVSAVVHADPAEMADFDMVYIVYPVYSLTLPNIVKRFLQRVPKRPMSSGSTGGPRVVLIATEGAKDEEGWALVTGRRILERKGYAVVHSSAIPMPSNWTTVERTQPPEEASAMDRAADSAVASIVRQVEEGGQHHTPLVIPKYGTEASYLMRFLFPPIGRPVLGLLFHAGKACTNCGLCIRTCPVQAIQPGARRPRWTVSCEQCMRCVSSCPCNAILQLDAWLIGSRNPRYVHPDCDLGELVRCEQIGSLHDPRRRED